MPQSISNLLRIFLAESHTELLPMSVSESKDGSIKFRGYKLDLSGGASTSNWMEMKGLRWLESVF